MPPRGDHPPPLGGPRAVAGADPFPAGRVADLANRRSASDAAVRAWFRRWAAVGGGGRRWAAVVPHDG